MCLFLWIGRNKARYDDHRFSAQRVILEVEEFLYDLGRARKFTKEQFLGDMDCHWTRFISIVPRRVRMIPVAWRRHPKLMHKLNTDASVINGVARGGGVLQDKVQNKLIL